MHEASANQRLELSLSGMSCHACAALIQDELGETPGVRRAEVSFEQKRAVVEFDAERANAEAIVQAVRRLGYQAVPV